ncbi:hypothetical protein Goshw_025217, partial [Gossypium schwendimanii]|nr:hypothetical protein [Gossypium schwendimanii]
METSHDSDHLDKFDEISQSHFQKFVDSNTNDINKFSKEIDDEDDDNYERLLEEKEDNDGD